MPERPPPTKATSGLIIDEPNWRTCATCSRTFTRLFASVDGDEACEDCLTARVDLDRCRVQGEVILRVLGSVLERFLRKAGMAQIELQARPERVPVKIRDLWPDEIVDLMIAGKIPSHGFGLSGGTGTGKTCALACVTSTLARQRIVTEALTLGVEVLSLWISWLPWPSTVARLRSMAARDGGFQDAEKLIRHASTVPVLVLDDLGRERIRGITGDDWAASQLDLVIEERHRELLPTWYTTNLGAKGLVQRYGSRLFSRLCGPNPLFDIGDGPDLRMTRESGC